MQIIMKFSNVAGKVPVAADLVIGELALNTADGIVYMLLGNGTVKVLLQ